MDELAGTWRLVSWQVIHADGRVECPFGQDAVGLLVYDSSGYMSGTMMRADRATFSRPRSQAVEFDAGESAELAAAFNSFLSYAGRWDIGEDGRVRHHVEVASIPGWAGITLVREVELEGEELTLRTPSRTVSGGEQYGMLRWRRAR